jgi:cytidylate kinase
MGRIIAIDGPAGSGKSTVAKSVSERLNLTYVSGGGLFRTVSIACKNANLDDINEIEEILKNIKIDQQKDRLLLNGIDVTEETRKKETTLLVPIIAKIPVVRKFVETLQHEIASNKDVIVEGRDTTSVVFPNATLKVFMTASIDKRAKRRFDEGKSNQTLEEIKKDIALRDKMDMEREVSPMIQVEDAFYIDTDNLSTEEVIDLVINEFNKR